MKHQVLFPLKNNEKYSRLLSAAVVIRAFSVNRKNLAILFFFTNTINIKLPPNMRV